MDHDRLFKELISAFFVEFVELLLPDIASYLDPQAAIVPLDKEIFTDVTAGDKHEVDLVMKVKVRGQDSFFLIHVENQSRRQTDFPRRMFHYCARLMEKYDLPVYPVVIFSHDKPVQPEPDYYEVVFPGKTVLRFEYTVVQLNRIPWRAYAAVPNPVACALMAKLNIPGQDRPLVKVQCLRLLATLSLDPAKSRLIGGFIDSYLVLTAQEMTQFEREIAHLDPKERNTAMALVSSWEQKGIEKGIEKGKEELILLLIQQRFGVVPDPVVPKLDRLSSSQLNDLGKDLLAFTDIDDLTRWLTRVQ